MPIIMTSKKYPSFISWTHPDGYAYINAFTCFIIPKAIPHKDLNSHNQYEPQVYRLQKKSPRFSPYAQL